MEALMMLWDFAPELKTKLLYLAIVGQIIITIYCYSAMSKARVAAVRGNRMQPENYKATVDEPDDLRVFTRAVANQFEMPVVFYVRSMLSRNTDLDVLRGLPDFDELER